MIYAIIWAVVAVLLFGIFVFLEGETQEYTITVSVFWPFCLVIATICGPFVSAYYIAMYLRRHTRWDE